jgi:hypothetical protein
MGASVILKGRGLMISTCFNISDAVKLVNVLIIKYSLHCNLLILNKNKTRIYIYRSSLVNLIGILKPVLTYSVNNIAGFRERSSCFSNFLEEVTRNSYEESSAANLNLPL